MTSEITWTDELTVAFRRASGDDIAICEAATVSTGSDEDVALFTEAKIAGLINYLMKMRHGSPFEHSSITFRISAPIFVWREFMRHRIASYNEQSARYMQMEPKFYNYPIIRPLVQKGSSAHPDIQHGDMVLHTIVTTEVEHANRVAWESYQYMITAGAALEAARAVLPVNIYSSAYVTMNARALMNFLSLRVASDDATYKTHPQWEINRVADAMEVEFARLFPVTHAAFVANGRVAP
jgi:thymidylate synthase (FAD)